MNSFFITKKSSTKAFTLLETLVSISIITFVVLGPLAFFVNSSSYARVTRETMIASSLAEESIELLQNHYDSLLVLCFKNPSHSICTPTTRESDPSRTLTPFHISWRVFKQQLHAKDGQPSCFEDENSAGCSFDFYNFSGSMDNTPSRYTATDEECAYLKGVASSTFAFTYVCNGRNVLGTTNPSVSYKRVVTLTHYPSFASSTEDGITYDYDDDILVVSRVMYKATNGRTNTVEARRFIHPRI